jgi:hypothetical protein
MGLAFFKGTNQRPPKETKVPMNAIKRQFYKNQTKLSLLPQRFVIMVKFIS